MDRADEAHRLRLLRADDPAGQCKVQRVGDADDAWQEPARRRLRHDAAPREDEAEARRVARDPRVRSEEHTSELQSLMRISYAVFCLKKKKKTINIEKRHNTRNYITYQI